MNADSYFTIGSIHQVCEDYSLSGGKGDKSFAVMSDGCSGSPRTDFGARFLSLAMEQILGQGPRKNLNLLHNDGLALAERMVRNMMDCSQLDFYCLDATLGYVLSEEDSFRTFLSGDGVIAARKKNGDKWCAVIEYPSGAPPYMSYSLDKERTAFYMKTTNGCPFTIDIHEQTASLDYKKTTLEDEGMHSHVFMFPKDEYDLVMVMSDGATSFQKPVSSETSRNFVEVSPVEIVDKLLNVKAAKGEFIKRRCKRMLKELYQKGWKHLDDLSVAALHGDES